MTRKERRKMEKIARDVGGSVYFDARWYLDTYDDVAQSAHYARRPALHYVCFGAKEGRNPSRVFDTQWYLESNWDVAEDGMNPLWHFVRYGRHEGRKALPGLDWKSENR